MIPSTARGSQRHLRRHAAVGTTPARFLAVANPRVGMSEGVCACGANVTPACGPFRRPAGPVEPKWQLTSADDGTWKAALTDPGADWARPDFRDTRWLQLERRGTMLNNPREDGYHVFRACVDAGAIGLGLPKSAPAGTGT